MSAKDQFAAHVGLDWANKKHDVCVKFKNGDRIFHVIEHTPEALDTWLKRGSELHCLKMQYTGRNISQFRSVYGRFSFMP